MTARGRSWARVALVVVLVAFMVVPIGTRSWGEHPLEPNSISSRFHSGLDQGAERVPQSKPRTVGPGSVNWTLCLSNNTLLNGNVACSTSSLDPIGIAWDSSNGDVYITNQAANNVSVVSGTTNRVVATIPLGGMPYDVVYDSSDGDVYVTAQDTLSVINGSTNKVEATLPAGVGSAGLAYDSADGEIYVAEGGGDNVSVINPTTGKIVSSIPVGVGPLGMAYDGANGDVYVTNANSNNVSVISGSSNKVVASFPVGRAPHREAYDGVNGDIYVANTFSDNVSVINGSTNKVVDSIAVGGNPIGVAYSGADGYVYVTNDANDSLSVIDGRTNLVVATIPVGFNPVAAAYDEGNSDTYIANFVNGSVSIIATGPALPNYPVAFTESGLPNGTAWSVAAAGATLASTSSAITLALPNGAYTFSIGTVAGYIANATLGNVTVNGGPISRPITFSPLGGLASVAVNPSLVTVKAGTSTNFTALPTCMGGPCSDVNYSWSLNNSLGRLNSSYGPRVLFTANSTAGHVNLTLTAYQKGKSVDNFSAITLSCGPSPGIAICSFVATPRIIQLGQTTHLVVSASDWGQLVFLSYTYAGLPVGCSSTNAMSLNCTPTSSGFYNVRVFVNDTAGHTASAIAALTVTPPLYPITISESGLPSGATWSVTLNGATNTSFTSMIGFAEINGSYNYTTSGPTGYTPFPLTGTLSVAGKAVIQRVTFTKSSSRATYTVTFTETELPSGTSWSVKLNGSAQYSTSAAITYQEVNGSYGYSVETVSGYTTSPSSGTLEVNGGPVNQTITFASSSAKSKTNQTTGFLGLPGYVGYIAIGAVLVVVVVSVLVLLLRKRRQSHGSSVAAPAQQDREPESPP